MIPLELLGASSGDPLVDWLSRAGALGILAVCVVAFFRRWIVPGAEFERVIDERDRALDLVYKQAEVASKALEISRKGNG